VVGKKDEFMSRIDFLRHNLMRHMEKLVHEKKSTLGQLLMESSLAYFPGHLQELDQRLDGGEFTLNRLFQQSLNRGLSRWNHAGQRFAAFDMGAMLKNRELQIQNLGTSLAANFSQRLQQRREKINVLDSKLAGMNPESVLAKGYSITTDQHQRLVKDSSVLAADEKISIRFARGMTAARVIKE
jgi:exodeoxyribonuclease VII large subunit